MRALFLLFMVGTVLFLYALLIEPNRLVITNYDIVTPKWTHDKPLRIALVADVHAIEPWMDVKKVEKIVARTNKLNADLVLLLGDYVGSAPFATDIKPEDGMRPYLALSAPCGVYAIMGNHDTHPKNPEWPTGIRNSGLKILENQAVETSCQGREFWIAGLEDLWFQKPDIPKTLKQVTNDNPIILAMHNPDSFPDIPNKVALSTAGHTHLGQISLPAIGAIDALVPSEYGERFLHGHIIENGNDLVVSGGLGTSIVPLRFNAPPEIVVITLSKGP